MMLIHRIAEAYVGDMNPEGFLRAVEQEIASARRKFPGQEGHISPEAWLAILVEEVGEVARELNDWALLDKPEKVAANDAQAELVQVAAMAFRMFASLEVFN